MWSEQIFYRRKVEKGGKLSMSLEEWENQNDKQYLGEMERYGEIFYNTST